MKSYSVVLGDLNAAESRGLTSYVDATEGVSMRDGRTSAEDSGKVHYDGVTVKINVKSPSDSPRRGRKEIRERMDGLRDALFPELK